MLDALPFLTTPLPSIGGRLKVVPAHFIVTELLEPREDATGELTRTTGKHCFVTIQRSLMTTHDVRLRLSELFDVRPNEIGYAGLKDMRAIATQTFSLPRERLPCELRTPDALDAIAARVRSDTRLQVIGEPGWHQRKLKVGELVGNRFEIVVSGCAVPSAIALERAEAMAAQLRVSGWANYYGPQRFGRAGPDHALRRGAELLRARLNGDSRQRHAHAGWLATLMLSALQSSLYNQYLAERIRRGDFGRVYVGDFVAQPHSASKPRMVRSGSSGQSADGTLAEAETAELVAFDISHLGPMFGGGMVHSGGVPAALEAEVWSAHVADVPLRALKRSVLAGSRRVNRLPLPVDFSVEEACEADGLRVRFSLPRGAYATSLLREFMHCDDAGALGEVDDGGDAGIEQEGDEAFLPADETSTDAPVSTPAVAASHCGLRVTADPSHLEKRALRELARLLPKLCCAPTTEPYPPEARRERRFGVQTMSAGELPFVSFAAETSDPVETVLRILDDAPAAARAMPTVARLMPVQATCPASSAELQAALSPLLERTWPRDAHSFAVVVRTRRRAGAPQADLKRDEVIQVVGEQVRTVLADAAVDLRQPDVTIHVEMVLEVHSQLCCLSVLPRWQALDEYKLPRAAVDAEGLIGSVGEAGSDGVPTLA